MIKYQSTLSVGNLLVAAASFVLISCGGGGGGGASGTSSSSSSAASGPFPAAGSFTYALVPAGSASALSLGFSFIHPDDRAVEYQVEAPGSNMTDVTTIYSGIVDVPNKRVTTIQPVALLYIVKGDVKRLPFAANGKHPKENAQSAGVTDLCKLRVRGNDYGATLNSRFTASTMGADKACDTGDDGEAEITFNTAGTPTVTINSVKTLGMLRDPVTLKPSVWIQPSSTVTFPGGGFVNMRTGPFAGRPALDRVVAQTADSVVAEAGGNLTVWRLSGVGAPPIETILTTGFTAGTGWQTIGFDANRYYLYHNTGTTATSTWKIVSITRVTPTASLLATGAGTGFVFSAAMGTNALFSTIQSASGFTLLKIDKLTPTATPLTATSANILPTILASNQGVHLLWSVNLASGASTYTIEMVDEAGTPLRTVPGGFPLGLAGGGTVDLNQSEDRSQYLIASGATAAGGLRGATLLTYDAAILGGASKTLGSLPGDATYGTELVVSGATFENRSLQGGYVASTAAGVIRPESVKTYSFDMRTTNSLQLTTSAR